MNSGSARQFGNRRVLHYGLAIGIVAALLLLRTPLQQFVPGTMFIVSFASLIAVAWFLGLGPALVAIVTALASFNYIFTPPAGAFSLDLPREAFRFGFYGGVAGITSLAAARLRTAKLQAEHATARLRAIIDGAVDAIITTDERGVIESANPATARIFGYSAQELIGKDLSLLVPRADESGHDVHPDTMLRPGVREILGTGRELVARRRDGITFPIELAVSETRLPGRPVFTINIRDITERRAADQASRFLAAIVESTDDAIIGKTLQGTITSWNLGAERMYGYSADEAVGRPIRMLVPPEIENDVPGILERLARGDRIENYPTLRMRGDGTRLHVSLTISPIHDTAGRIVGASTIARDITEAVEMQHALEENAQELEELNAELEQTIEELQQQQEETERARDAAQAASRAKSQFLATMSHELRTPLTGIVGYADLLEGEVVGPLNERQKDQLIRIKSGAWHLKAVIDEILTFARVEAGREEIRRERFDIVALAREALALVEPQASNKGLELRVSLPAAPIHVVTDPGKLRQIFLNLLGNAVKFTDRGGVSLDLVHEDGWVLFRVSDTGPGIPHAELERIFEPFTQLDQEMTRTKGGTGLGLAVTRRLIELLGGEVRVESEVGRGSTFIGRLPAPDSDRSTPLPQGESPA